MAVQSRSSEDHRRHDVELAFPRSVSPYVARRKSENRHRRSYSTPHVGLTSSESCSMPAAKKKYSKFSLLKNLFGSRSSSDKTDSASACSNSDPRISPPRGPCLAPSSSYSSPSWLSFLSSRRQKQPPTGDAKAHASRISNRGMSPDAGVELDDHLNDGFSSEPSQQGRLRTPVTAVTPTSVRRRRAGHTKSASGLAFCLSPLVRVSPSRQWNQKGSLQPEIGVSGEIRVPGKPYLLAAAAASCGNRSRKLANIGRVSYNHRPG